MGRMSSRPPPSSLPNISGDQLVRALANFGWESLDSTPTTRRIETPKRHARRAARRRAQSNAPDRDARTVTTEETCSPRCSAARAASACGATSPRPSGHRCVLMSVFERPCRTARPFRCPPHRLGRSGRARRTVGWSGSSHSFPKRPRARGGTEGWRSSPGKAIPWRRSSAA
jgi:hypothetical protein